MVDRECPPDGYRLVQQIMTNLHWVSECILAVVNRFDTRAVSVATSMHLLSLSLTLRTLTICLLLVYFVSAAGCHCFDLIVY